MLKLLRNTIIIVLTLATCTGCAVQTTSPLLDNDQLRQEYPAIYDYEMYSTMKVFSFDSISKQVPVIVVATPVTEPLEFINEVSLGENTPEKLLNEKVSSDGSIKLEYVSIKVKIAEILKGKTEEDTITISVPKQNSAFIDAMKKGQKYVLCLVPAEYIGKNNWDSVTDIVFYISSSDQIVPFSDDKAHKELIGMKYSDFKDRINKNNKK